MGLPEVLDDLRLFHHVAPPENPEEFRLAARLVKALTYVTLFATAISPFGIVYGALSNNALLLMASLAAVPSFVLLAMSYPAFVHGERWALVAILIVGLAIAILAPLRFFTEAAALDRLAAATPPTPAEIVVFLGACILIYILLLPETREGMRQARGDHPTPERPRRTPEAYPYAGAPAPSRPGTPSARPARVATPATQGRDAQAGTAPYACPSCGRLYHLKTIPPPGTLCPTCRRVEDADHQCPTCGDNLVRDGEGLRRCPRGHGRFVAPQHRANLLGRDTIASVGSAREVPGDLACPAGCPTALHVRVVDLVEGAHPIRVPACATCGGWWLEEGTVEALVDARRAAGSRTTMDDEADISWD